MQLKSIARSAALNQLKGYRTYTEHEGVIQCHRARIVLVVLKSRKKPQLAEKKLFVAADWELWIPYLRAIIDACRHQSFDNRDTNWQQRKPVQHHSQHVAAVSTRSAIRNNSDHTCMTRTTRRQSRTPSLPNLRLSMVMVRSTASCPMEAGQHSHTQSPRTRVQRVESY